MSPDQQNPVPAQPQNSPTPGSQSPQQPGSLQPGEAFLVRPTAEQSQPNVPAPQPGQPAQPTQSAQAAEPMIPYHPNPAAQQPVGQFAAPPLQPLQPSQSRTVQQPSAAYQPQNTTTYQTAQPQASAVPTQPSAQQPPAYPAQPAPAQSSSPYDFFLNEPKQAKKPLLPLPPKPTNRFNTIMYIAAAVIVVIILLSVILGIANRNKGKNPQLTAITTTQQHIIYTSSAAANNLQSSDLAGFANTARDTTTTAQQQLITYLQKNGVMVNAKLLAALKDPQTDNALAAAKTAGTYDASYAQIMQRLLQEYSQEIDTARSTATGPNEVKLLSQEQDSVKLLQTMLNSTSSQADSN